MRLKQIHPKKAVKRLKQYNKEMMLKAFDAVKNNKTPVDRAARLFDVPAQTLRDCVLGKVGIKSSWGKTSLFTSNEEESLVNYLEDLAKVGYGLNRSQLNVLATEMAIKLGKLNQGKSLSDKWYYAFLKRWDHRLKVIKPRGLTSTRVSALRQEVVTAYFADLNMVLTENCLQFKPHLIYNLDETGLQPEHRPSKVIAGKSSGKIQAVTSPNSSTTTLIACINAAGTALPPFYVFKGKLRNDELLKGAALNSAYEMSDSDIMKWAIEHNVILFVLPPRASHALQPLDVGCFAPFKACYYSECNLFMAKQRGQIITRYEIAALSGKAYLKSMTPSNIIAAFKKCGIFPFDSSVVPEELLFPSRSFPKKKISEAEESSPTMQELLSQKMMDTAPKVKSPKVRSKKPKLGGKCITSAVVQEVEEYELSRKKPSQFSETFMC
ncbi:uncharacterized protein LOC132738084 [Ruditapes philippinarum]|uniref:uncharacterized protein LOC132738084 n=1 Tax=Ruditapes philippinarum TaxID=129788 RepID=UPI00295BD9D6|nr:uncharacterized protein LOC132738084 [Ruditapes philippinarum]